MGTAGWSAVGRVCCQDQRCQRYTQLHCAVPVCGSGKAIALHCDDFGPFFDCLFLEHVDERSDYIHLITKSIRNPQCRRKQSAGPRHRRVGWDRHRVGSMRRGIGVRGGLVLLPERNGRCGAERRG